MKKFLLFGYSLLLIITVACQPIEQAVHEPALRPGDEIDGMTITTGAGHAIPLWAFCTTGQENGNIIYEDCRVPWISKLAIAYPFESANKTLQALDWSVWAWQLSLDGHRLDLSAFGIYTYVLPELAPQPSPVREIFRQKKAWNVVLENPTPGQHTLRGMARKEADTYEWLINFSVEEPPAR